MNREQAKKLLPIIQAFAKGRPIEYQDSYEKWIESDIMAFDLSPENYRIKRETKYRPFKDAEECWQEMQKHQPFGWLKDKKDDHYILITAISNTDVDQITSNGNISWIFCSISKFYTFADVCKDGYLKNKKMNIKSSMNE